VLDTNLVFEWTPLIPLEMGLTDEEED